MSILKKVVTIAGSDTSGGAGIQADLKTFQERGVFGMNILTVIVSMGSKWEHKVFPVEMETIREQSDTVFKGIGVDGIKTGMLPTVEIIEYAGSLIRNVRTYLLWWILLWYVKGRKTHFSPKIQWQCKNILCRMLL